MERTEDWTSDIILCIDKIKKDVFSLNDVYEFEEYLSKLHPRNRNIRAKIRQQLQILRDEGRLNFIDNSGNYEKRY